MKSLIVNALYEHQVVAKTLLPYTGQSGLYSSRLPDEESTTTLLALVAELGLPFNQADELHVTVIYSPEKTVEQERVMRNVHQISVSAQIIGFEVFGKDNDTVVALLRSEQLVLDHLKWKALGAEPTWPDYRPHLSLYVGDSIDRKSLDAANAALQNRAPVCITLGPEQIEDIQP
jgi:hypothetical protein